MDRLKILNAWQMKLLMAALMVLDHIRHIQGFVPYDMASVFIIASRCVAPMFAYLVIEGILHTGNLKKYCLRLFILCFPFILLYNGERGPRNLFTKHFFYIFYPVHMWIIAVVNFVVSVHWTQSMPFKSDNRCRSNNQSSTRFDGCFSFLFSEVMNALAYCRP